MNPIFGSSCVSKSLPLKGSPITRVLEAGRIKKAKPGGNRVAGSIKTAKIGVNSTKLEKFG